MSGSVGQRLQAVVDRCSAGDFEALRFALYDAAPTVRQLAVSCWDPTAGGADVLVPLTRDPDGSVRTSLAEVLARSGEPDARAMLSVMLADGEPAIRAIAASGVELADASAAAEQLGPLLLDSNLEVSAAAAQRLERAGAQDLLTAEQRARIESALAVAELQREMPEIVGALNVLHEQLGDLIGELERQTRDEAGCADATLAALESASGEARELALTSTADKPFDRFELLLAFQSKVDDLVRAYHTCMTATPLSFDMTSGSLPFSSVDLLITGEVESNWWANFGLLRMDRDTAIGQADGGDLWIVGDAVVSAFFPGRPGGLTAPLQVPSLDVSALVRRDQLYRSNELSSWNGGALVRGEIPFGCGSGESCRFTGLALAEQTLGSDSDFPNRLVAARREIDGELALRIPVASVVGTLSLDGALVRYRQDPLSPANLDDVGLHLTIDSPFQLVMGATRNSYPVDGPIEERTEENAAIERDNVLLDAMLGVRFGGADPDASLQLVFLGGVALPLFDVLETDIDPQITFEARMIAQSGTIGGDLSRMRLAGRRWVEAAAQDYALQTVTRSSIDYVYQGVSRPDSGARFWITFWHELVQGLEPLVPETDTDTNLIGGELGVRFLVKRWLGFEIANDILAVRFGNQDFRVENRFLLSVFVPMGVYDFGLAEALPW